MKFFRGIVSAGKPASPSSKTLRIVFLVWVLGLWVAAVRAPAADFQAVVRHHPAGGKGATPGKPESIAVRGNWVRLETFRRGKRIIRIHRPDLQTTFDIDPAAKTYKELPYAPGTDWTSWYALYKPVLKAVGRETVAGWTCDKYAAPGNAAVFWICPALGFPLQITQGNLWVALDDIREGPADDRLFTPPPGYRRTFSFRQGGPMAAPLESAPAAIRRTRVPGPSPVKEDRPDETLEAARPSAGSAFYDFSLKMFLHPPDGARVEDPRRPIVVRFNQPVQPVFFSFKITPDPGGWETAWNEDHRSVTLRHRMPFQSGQTYTCTAEVLGGPQRRFTFRVKAPTPKALLEQDLAESRIDINQAATYRLLRLVAPSKIPQRYRPRASIKCATANFRQVQRDFARLDRKTRDRLRPYFLLPTNPGSYWYRKLVKASRLRESVFRLTRPAFAAVPWYRETYLTDTGVRIAVIGSPRQKKTIARARKLLDEKKIYERLERLMGRKTKGAAAHGLTIVIFDTLTGADADDFGLCGANEEGLPYIVISEKQCTTKRLLGGTLAHEIFHAFQFAFADDFDDWIGEGTATWAEDFISADWNTEQEYTFDAFNTTLHELLELDDNGGLGVYGRYLFPFYLTRVSPGNSHIIRKIWENLHAGKTAVEAVRAAVGSFDRIWKKYVLAVLDEESEMGRFPDVDNQYGDGPLELSVIHDFSKFKINPSGAGGLAVLIAPLSAVYCKLTNDNQGADAPAIRLDLSEFQKDDKVSLQALVVYRNGRSEYEDWSDRDRRIFCLNHKKENFSTIYLVAARGADREESGLRPLLLDIYPEVESDCDHGTAVMTLRVHGNEKTTQKFRRGAAGFSEVHSNWNRYVTIRMEIAPWRDEIPGPAERALDRLDATYPGVDTDHINQGRKAFRAAMRAARKYDDPNTGCTVFKYRVKSCDVRLGGGIHRSHHTEEHRDSMGVVRSSQGSFSENINGVRLDDETRQRLQDGQMSVRVYVDPGKGNIRWVQFPLVGVKTTLHAHNSGSETERYQDESGAYHYHYHDSNWQKDTESGMQVTFDSHVPPERRKPMDPVWRARSGGRLSASGRGRNMRPIRHRWNTYDDSGENSGQEITEFRWKLTLKESPHGP